jgi:hypothetical protein
VGTSKTHDPGHWPLQNRHFAGANFVMHSSVAVGLTSSSKKAYRNRLFVALSCGFAGVLTTFFLLLYFGDLSALRNREQQKTPAITEESNLNSAQRSPIDLTSINGKPFRNSTQEAQYLLKLLGYDIQHADGFEGPKTTYMLEQFQREFNLPNHLPPAERVV